jgi:hypothetical protein
MTITAGEGPHGTFGQAPLFDSNPEAGPSFWYQGDMLLDPRSQYTYLPGQSGGKATFGWPTTGMIPIIDQSPSTLSTSNIVNAATPAAGTPLTLVSASGSGVTVGCSLINANTGVNVTGLLGLDVAAARTVTGTFTNGSPKITFTGATMQGVQVGDQITLTSSGTLPTPFALLTTYYVNAIGAAALMLAATPNGPPISATSAGSGTQTLNVTAPNTYDNSPYIPFQPPVVFGTGGTGLGGPIRYWDPAWALSRTLILTNNGNDSSGFYLVSGYDIYGYPMSQLLTGPSTGTVSTTKAFKYITSIVPSGTIASTSVSVGTNDVFGLPLRTDYVTSLFAYFNNAALIVPSAAPFVAADITTPSTTTGDVRGTYYSGVASDGTKRLTVFWNPIAANMNSTAGLLGQPQT